jgi:hypothetical protein
VKHLRGTKTWTRACDALREEIVCFVREKLAFATDGRGLIVRCANETLGS